MKKEEVASSRVSTFFEAFIVFYSAVNNAKEGLRINNKKYAETSKQDYLTHIQRPITEDKEFKKKHKPDPESRDARRN